MRGRKKIRPATSGKVKAAPAAGFAGAGCRDRFRLEALPLQKEFESLRRFAAGYGLTAEKLARMARALERYPVGARKGVLESLRALAENRRIPFTRLTQLAETLVHEPELEHQIGLITGEVSPAGGPGRAGGTVDPAGVPEEDEVIEFRKKRRNQRSEYRKKT